MSFRDAEHFSVQQLLALKATDDLTDVEDRLVDRLLAESSEARTHLAVHTAQVEQLRTLAVDCPALADRPSLWDRIEPQLGPLASRPVRRSSFAIPTSYLVTASIALVALTLVLEFNPIRPQQMRVMGRVPTSVNNGLVRDVMGLELQPLSQNLAHRLGVPLGQGAVVSQVDRWGMDNAAVQAGDVITELEGRPVTSPADVAEILAEESTRQPPPALLRIRVFRVGQPILLRVRCNWSRVMTL